MRLEIVVLVNIVTTEANAAALRAISNTRGTRVRLYVTSMVMVEVKPVLVLLLLR